jgi:hypothetical protein
MRMRKKPTSGPAIDTVVILPVTHQRHDVVQLRAPLVVLQILAVAALVDGHRERLLLARRTPEVASRRAVVAWDVDADQRRGSAIAMARRPW